MKLPWQALAEQRALTLAYRRTFEHEAARVVLADLAIYCRATSSAAEEDTDGRLDPLVLAREEGKRAVWLRLANMLGVDREEIARALRLRQAEILSEVGSTIERARTQR